MTNWARSLVRAGRRYLVGSRASQVVRGVVADKLTYLSLDALQDLFDLTRHVEAAGVQGAIIEAGCALGGSAIVLAAAKNEVRPLYVYDVFSMIPPPSDKDGSDVHARYELIRNGRSKGIGGDLYYGYQEDLLEQVTENFRRHGVPIEQKNVTLIKGLFEDVLNITGTVAMAHIDGDWYQSVMTCLKRIEPHLQDGGTLVIDDYEAYSGCRRAVDEYFAGRRGEYVFKKKARLHITKRR